MAKVKSAGAPAKAAEPVKESQILPAREASLFKQLVTLYETKKYKKAIKAADAILARFPNNGETLAMKGLTLNSMKKKDEAKALVKKGLALNLKSHVCWHVFGLLYRSERQYDEAIKCYVQALKIDKENSQIMKDLANLQIQQRNMEGFQETRRKLLLQKTNKRENWLAYAIGNHLSGHSERALDVLTSFESTFDSKEKSETDEEKIKSAFETSELRLYKAMVLIDGQQYERALQHLESVKKDIRDVIAWHEIKADILLRLNRHSEAEEVYRHLLGITIDNYSYHAGLRAALGIAPTKSANGVDVYSDNHVAVLLKVYDDLANAYPKSSAVRRVPLDFLPAGDAFQGRLDKYLRSGIRKGVPSLFRDVATLYRDPAKLQLTERVITTYIQQLQTKKRFWDSDAEDSESPSTVLWALYFAGQHYDYLQRYDEALRVVEAGITHTPTAIDFYVLKARIYKHLGDHETAFELMDQARNMDLADRYLNTKCTRYAHRAGRIDEAEKIVLLFIRDGENITSLFDMQVMWYEISAGKWFFKARDFGRALKFFTSVDKHFDDMHEDQFDFHTYCLRKMTLRSYIKMLRWEDTVWNHRFFFKGACGAVQTYLAIDDDTKREAEEKQRSEAELARMDPEERKKLEKARKKQESKANRSAAKEQQLKDEEKKKVSEKAKLLSKSGEVDEDPYGEKLAKVADPLLEATKYLKKLQQFCSHEIESHLLAAEVYLRRNKLLLALRALKRAVALDANHPTLHSLLVRFFVTVDRTQSSLDPFLQQVIAAERQELLGGATRDLRVFSAEFAKRFSQSLAHRRAAAAALLALSPDDTSAKGEVIKLVTDLSGAPVDWQQCYESLAFLDTKLREDATAVTAKETFRATLLQRFPLNPAFMNAEQLQAKQTERLRLQAEKAEREKAVLYPENVVVTASS